MIDRPHKIEYRPDLLNQKKRANMKALGAGVGFILLVPVMIALGIAFAGFLTMILFGNLHVIFPAVPPIGFGSAASIGFPILVLLGASVNKNN